MNSREERLRHRRGHDGCRNIDLLTSATRPGRYLVVQKWDTPESQRAHFDSDETNEEIIRLFEGEDSWWPDDE